MDHILLATTRFPPEIASGVETVAAGLSQAFTRLGCRVTVITSTDQLREDSFGSVKVFGFPSMHRREGPWWMLRSTFRFFSGRRISHVKNESFKGIICNSPQYVVWARFFYPQVPVLFICHGLYAVDKKISALAMDTVEKNRTFRTRFFLKFSYWVKCLQEKSAYIFSHRIISLNETMSKDLSEYAKVKKYKIIEIPNGIDLQLIPFKERKTANSSLRILYVGRLSYIKNVNYLIKSLSHLSHLDSWKCRIIGDGDELSYLKEMVKDLDLSDNIEFLGWVDDPRHHYEWADVFVIPSKWEGFSLSLLEALASGLPCIGLKHDGVSFLADYSNTIFQEKTGFLVDGNNPQDLSNVLCRLWASSEERTRIGENSRKLVEDLFTWDSIAQKYINSIERIAN